MERILILHASVGTGHKSAANALREAFSLNPQRVVRVEDTLDYSTPVFREAYSRSYLQLSEKAPLLWKLFYETFDTSDADMALIGNRLRGLIERPLVSKLDALVENFKPSAVICTHFLPVEILERLKRAGTLKAPIFCVVTDFVAQSTWMNSAVDCYFLASEMTRQEMITRGIAAELLRVSGIPVKLEISEPKMMDEMRVKHGFAPDKPLITLFGGGIDPRRVRMMVTGLLGSELEGELVVVAGRSQSLMEALSDVGDGPTLKLRKFGYVDFVDDLVAACDLVITKSGGLIVSEILARGTPMIIIDPIFGQEEWNADYVAGVGAGLQLRMAETVPLAVIDLFRNPQRLALMQLAAKRAGRPRAALDIASQVLEDLRSGKFA